MSVCLMSICNMTSVTLCTPSTLHTHVALALVLLQVSDEALAKADERFDAMAQLDVAQMIHNVYNLEFDALG